MEKKKLEDFERCIFNIDMVEGFVNIGPMSNKKYNLLVPAQSCPGGKRKLHPQGDFETLGKETIDLYNTSDTRGIIPSFWHKLPKDRKELMSRDELAVMDGSKCILQLRGVRPFLSDKFDITKHKRYKELSDFDKKNEFDIERYLKHELRLLTTEEFDLYEVDVTEQAQG